MIKLTVEGAVYEFDGDRLLLAEARELKTYTKLTPPRWSVGLDEGDPDATQFLVYLAKKRAGENLRFSDLDTLDYADILMEEISADGDEKQAEAGAEAAADPTPPPVPPSAGQTPSDGTGDTSPPSPTTSSTPPTTSTP